MKENYTVRKMRVIFVLAMLFSLVIVGPGWGSDWPEKVVVISPAAGASAHMVLVGMGKAVKKYTPIKYWIVQPLGGPKVWLPLMKNDCCDFANHSAPDILNAFLGRGGYTEMGPQPVRTVIAGHEYMFMFWTTPDKGIRSISDLKGKVAYINLKANPMFTEMGKVQLASAGLIFDDLKGVLSFSSIKEAIRDLIEGRVDAVLYPAVPGSVMQVTEAKGECIFVGLTKEQAKYVVDHMEGYYVEDISANDPRFRNTSPVPNAICYQQGMFCPAGMNSDVVYGVVKAVCDHEEEFADSHPAAKYWSDEFKPVTLSVPYHEGAIRYYKEKGVWTKEAEVYQEKMLKQQQDLLKKK